MGYMLIVMAGTLILGSAILIAMYVLGPAAKRERTSRAKTQFLMSDLLWLVVMMQAALAPVAGFMPRDFPVAFLAMFGLVFLVVLGLWWGIVRMFSRAGVRSQVRRGVLIAVVVPLTIVLMLALPLACLYLLGWYLAPYFLDSMPESPGIIELIALAVIAGVFPLAWLLRRVTLWGINDPAHGSAEMNRDIDFEAV